MHVHRIDDLPNTEIKRHGVEIIGHNGAVGAAEERNTYNVGCAASIAGIQKESLATTENYVAVMVSTWIPSWRNLIPFLLKTPA